MIAQKESYRLKKLAVGSKQQKVVNSGAYSSAFLKTA